MTAEVPADPAGTWGQVSALSYSPPPPLPPPLCTPSPPPHPTPPPPLFCPRKTSIAGCRCRGLWWTLAHSPSIDRPAKSIFSSPLTSCLGVWARERGREREERDRGRRRETEQGLRAVQLEGKNMDSECVRVCVCGRWKGQEKIWGTREQCLLCVVVRRRRMSACSSCWHEHTHTHTLLDALNHTRITASRRWQCSSKAPAESTHRWVAVSTQRLQRWGCTRPSLFHLLNHCFRAWSRITGVGSQILLLFTRFAWTCCPNFFIYFFSFNTDKAGYLQTWAHIYRNANIFRLKIWNS